MIELQKNLIMILILKKITHHKVSQLKKWQIILENQEPLVTREIVIVV